ncbi:MAG: molybdopterin-guanine dinucleotide biosynthesis protein B [Planctomycetota bacterium]|jgi:molybdopterin-guanine dinucleotide biosynthesis protein MobB
MSPSTPDHVPSPSGLTALPAVGICGYSGAGKTTLIERLVPRLLRQGLAVLVVKHDAHGLDVDTPGKDSDRFFRAGADVVARGPVEQFLRAHGGGNDRLKELLPELCLAYDLVLVEGHKASPLPKIWLLSEGEKTPPPQTANVLAVLGRGDDRLAAAMAVAQTRLQEQWSNVPVFGGVLIGGESSPVSMPKHLIRTAGRTRLKQAVEVLELLCRQVVILGDGAIPESLAGYPRLPDVPDAQGPLAGMLAAMRWAQWTSWLFVACDLPGMSAEALRWLLAARRPGVWATIPMLDEGPSKPLPAHCDFRSRPLLEGLAARRAFQVGSICAHPKVASPAVPSQLAHIWRNASKCEDLPDSIVEPGLCPL